MFLEKIQRFIKGYVEFQAKGGFPERFINLSSEKKLDIQNVKMYKETITASCDIAAYKKIRPIAKKAGMKIRMVKKHGLPFWIYKKRNRVGIVAGLLFFIIMTCVLSGYIWTVDVNGNVNIPSEDILEAFSSLGVKPGIKKGSFNTKETVRKALTEIDELMWTAINTDGCRITIEVKERVENKVEKEDETPSNIIASDSGQIILVENFLGTQVVETGSAVEKGDVIVSGAVINRDETVSFYKAEANVLARTKNTVNESVSFFEEMRIYEKVKKKYFLNFFTFEIPLNINLKKNGDYIFSSGEDFLSSEGQKLPLGIITQRKAYYKIRKVKIAENAAKLMCAEKYFREIDENFDDIEIEKTLTEKGKTTGGYKINSVFECIENIGESKKMDITIENDTDNAY